MILECNSKFDDLLVACDLDYITENFLFDDRLLPPHAFKNTFLMSVFVKVVFFVSVIYLFGNELHQLVDDISETQDVLPFFQVPKLYGKVFFLKC